MSTRLVGFSAAEEAMVSLALQHLAEAGFETDLLAELVRVEMPAGYRAMTLDEGAAVGAEALVSQEMLDHVLEEELLHLKQKLSGRAARFAPGTAQALEEEIDDQRRFPAPGLHSD